MLWVRMREGRRTGWGKGWGGWGSWGEGCGDARWGDRHELRVREEDAERDKDRANNGAVLRRALGLGEPEHPAALQVGTRRHL